MLVKWPVLVMIVGVLLSVWKMQNTAYARDMQRIEISLNKNSISIESMHRGNKTEVILAELKHNRDAINDMKQQIKLLRERLMGD